MFSSTKLKHSASDSTDKNGVKNRLKKFMTRRPSMKTLQEKGLIKGCCFWTVELCVLLRFINSVRLCQTCIDYSSILMLFHTLLVLLYHTFVSILNVFLKNEHFILTLDLVLGNLRWACRKHNKPSRVFSLINLKFFVLKVRVYGHGFSPRCTQSWLQPKSLSTSSLQENLATERKYGAQNLIAGSTSPFRS